MYTLQGYNRSECYIAAQGPMPNTESDFWRMIWEKKLVNIVMLTKCTEAGRVGDGWEGLVNGCGNIILMVFL